MPRGFNGVREDLADLRRHFLGIVYFLCPILSSFSRSEPRRSPPPRPASRRIAGMLADLAEFRDALRDGLSAVLGGCPKRESRESSAPEFLVTIDGDFDLSHVPGEHIPAIEIFAPDLAALRNRLCPAFVNETLFWRTYMALLHPRLNDHDSELIKEMQNSMDSRTHYYEAAQSLWTDDKGSIIQEENNHQSLGNQVFTMQRSEDLSYNHIDERSNFLLEKYFDSFLVDRIELSSDDSIRKLVPIGHMEDSDFEVVPIGHMEDSDFEVVDLHQVHRII
ncbi:uncharacterized protein [Typha latifolia]|uniref:uncharacterized protein isoform X2 n=1 Tax=Typha latifolia TaxID=4733 RepID=UPI003C2B8132